MRLIWEPNAEKHLARFSETMRQQITAAVHAYAAGGRGDVKKLQGKLAGRSRLRVGKCRVIFTRERDLLIVLDVDDRREAYR